MDDVSCIIDHDITIVSILDLENVADERIGCHAFYEVPSCLKSNEIEILLKIWIFKILEVAF